MKRVTISRAELDAFPEGAIWNAFVDLLSRSRLEQLDGTQQPAWRAFWYDSEVQNGGHAQYFGNRGLDEATAAIADLRLLGATEFSEVLTAALALRNSHDEPGDYETALAQDQELYTFDDAFYSIAPDLTKILEDHLVAHQDRYVVVEGQQ